MTRMTLHFHSHGGPMSAETRHRIWAALLGLGLSFLASKALGAEDWVERATVLNTQARFEDIHQLLESVKAAEVKNPEWYWRKSRNDHYRAHRCGADAGCAAVHINSGLEAGRRGLEVGETNGYVHAWYAELLLDQGERAGKPGKATGTLEFYTHVTRAMELMPNRAICHTLMGHWHFTLAELPYLQRRAALGELVSAPDPSFEEAEKYYTRALELDPDDAEQYLNMARVQIKLGKKAQARVNLERAIALAGHDALDNEYRPEAQQLLFELK